MEKETSKLASSSPLSSLQNSSKKSLKREKQFSCTAVAPCSTANFGPGFDTFGLGLDAFEDTVKIKIVRKNMRLSSSSIHPITIRLFGGKHVEGISVNVDENSAGLVIRKMYYDFDIQSRDNCKLDIEVIKKVPPGYGIGSSAASAAAAAVAFDRLFRLDLAREKLVDYAAEGEIASAGTRHYDNVSSSVLGGFVIVRSDPSLEFIRFDPPDDMYLVLAIPIMKVPLKKTQVARSILPAAVPLGDVTQNISNASTVVAGFALADTKLVAKGIRDVIVEPARKHMIPGYDLVKRNAIEAGALAVTISGAGPSMISIVDDKNVGNHVAKYMAIGFKQAGIEKSKTLVCRPSKGARIREIVE